MNPPADPTVSPAPPEHIDAEQHDEPRQSAQSLEDADYPEGAFVCAPADAETDVVDAPPSAVEKRTSFRHAFLRHVEVLGLADGQRPSDSERFQEVLCEDLSTGGAAVFLKHAPDFRRFIIKLGQPSAPTYLLARVAHVEPVFRIGCQFVRRIQRDPATGAWIGLSPHDAVEDVAVPRPDKQTPR